MKKGNFDLNVPWTPATKDTIGRTLGVLEELGWSAVAINHTVTGNIPKGPCPFGVLPSKLKQYRRITLVLSDHQHNHGLTELSSHYDLIAIQPETEKMFNLACQSLECDFISLDLTVARLPFSLRHSTVQTAIKRGITFEINYGPVIRDPTLRRNVIGNAMALCRLMGRNGPRLTHGLIISGGCEQPWECRAPLDIANMAALFGIPAHLRMNTLTDAPKWTIEHAATRKLTHHGAIQLVKRTADSDEPPAKESRLEEDFIQL